MTCLVPPSARFLLSLLLALPIGAPRPARAAPEGEAKQIARGVALRLQGCDEAACAIFSDAWRRFGTPRALAQLGLCAQALGRWVKAEHHLSAALAAEEDGWIGDKRQYLTDALAVVRGRLGSLEVVVEGPGATLSVDGVVVGPLPLTAPIRLAAGTVVVQVQAPAHVPVQRLVSISPGQLSRERFRLVQVPPPAVLPPRPVGPPPFPGTPVAKRAAAPPRFEPRPHLFWLAIGGTVLGAGLTTWSGLETLSARDRFLRDPTEQGFRRGLAQQRRTNVFLLGTGALAVVSLALNLLSHGQPP
jgi:hypothetical protein